MLIPVTELGSKQVLKKEVTYRRKILQRGKTLDKYGC